LTEFYRSTEAIARARAGKQHITEAAR
jgi:hypothetical protein